MVGGRSLELVNDVDPADFGGRVQVAPGIDILEDQRDAGFVGDLDLAKTAVDMDVPSVLVLMMPASIWMYPPPEEAPTLATVIWPVRASYWAVICASWSIDRRNRHIHDGVGDEAQLVKNLVVSQVGRQRGRQVQRPAGWLAGNDLALHVQGAGLDDDLSSHH